MSNEAGDARHSFDDTDPKDELRGLQIVRAGSVQFGVFADEIATILPWREPAPLPEAPASVLGVVSIQGRMLTVLELLTLTGREASSSAALPASSREIVALRGDEQLALAVDSVGDVVKIAASAIKFQSENAGGLVLGSLQLEDSEVNILNLRELFSAAIRGRERRRRRF